MRVSAKQYASGLYESVKGQDKKEIKKVISSFVRLLGSQRELSKVPAILASFNDIWDREEAEVSAELTTARSVKPALDSISTYLKKRTGAKTAYLKEIINHELIGGFVLRYQDHVLDASLESNLKTLQDKLEK